MIKRLSSKLDKTIGAKLKALGLVHGEFAVLMTLLDEENLTQTAIGQRIGMPGYATTRNIDTLEQKQLVERRADLQSRRSRRIFLTRKGRVMGADLFSIVEEVNREFLKPLSKTERENFGATLHKLMVAQGILPALSPEA